MQTTFNLNSIRVTNYAKGRLEQRGFTMSLLATVLANPESVYEAHKAEFKGQLRIQGEGMSIAFDPKSQTIVTVFFNNAIDPNWVPKSK